MQTRNSTKAMKIIWACACILVAILMAVGCLLIQSRTAMLTPSLEEGPAILGLTGANTGLYADGDNYEIATVTNKLYGEDNYCIFLHPFLCSVIGLMTGLFPGADCYMLLVHALIFCMIGWMTWLVLTSRRNIAEKMLMIIGLFVLSLSLNIWNENFTVPSVAITMAGCVTLFEAKNRTRLLPYTVIGTAFICFGYMLRWESAILVAPFAALELAVRGIEARKEPKAWLAQVLKTWGVAVVVLTLLVAGKAIVNTGAEYRDGIRYNEARSAMVDFPKRSWEEVSDELTQKGIDHPDYWAAVTWNMGDTDRMDTERIETIADVAAIKTTDFGAERISESIRILGQVLTVENIPLRDAMILALGLAVTILVSRMEWYRKLACGLAFAGFALIMLYFTVVGRAPSRVWTAASIAMLTLLFSCLLDGPATGRGETRRMIAVITAAVIACGGCVWRLTRVMDRQWLKWHDPVWAMEANSDQDEYMVMDYEDEGALYIWPEKYYQWYVIQYLSMENKLPSRELLKQNISLGGWSFGQPYHKQYLQSVGAPNPARALLERPDTYFASEETEEMLNYLRSRYGENVQVEDTGNMILWQVPVWKFYYGE